jgi:2-oxoisovalerate dehydrogenase E1 component beta subunit
MTELTILEAVRLALEEEMERNKNIVILGEDVGPNGGVFRATQGLQAKFGEKRVLDTPLNESGIIGFAIGMALYGLRPIAEIQFADFIWPAMDQIHSELAKFRYRSGGRFTTPVVIRAPYGGGVRGAHYHSQSPEAYFAHTPGLKVVMPSNPYDAKGLLTSAMRDEDPVLFFEPKRIYRAFKQEVPTGDYTVPIGQATVTREGKDVTLLSYGAMLHTAVQAAEIASDKLNIL